MDKGFKILERIMHAANTRHRVIASNIANADTPGYKARDVDFKKILGNEEIKLAKTSSNHINNSLDKGNNVKLIIEENPSWGDKNNVELDVEVAKMTENSLMLESALSIMAMKIRMFKSAISTRR